MSSSDPAAPQPSLVRTGAKAGLSFAGSVIKGALLGVFLGGGVFFFYLSQLQGPGNVAARAGGVGAALALITSPPLLVALLLLFFVVVYVALGVQQGRARAMHILPADFPISLPSVSGYSGGGRTMIEAYETGEAPAFEIYALGLKHKHIPEIMTYTRLTLR